MTKNKQKPKPPNKSELLEKLYGILDDNHWNLITRIIGREIKSNKSSRINFLGSILKKTIAVSSRKGKGRGLQQWACEQISKLTGIPWGNEDDHEIRSRPMGSSGSDVILSKRVRSLFPFTPECKNQETWKIESYIKQAKDSCYPETNWLVIISKNGHEELVVLDALVFFDSLKNKKHIATGTEPNEDKSE